MSTPNTPTDDGGVGPPADRTVSERIVAAIAEERGVDELEIGPVYETIDLEAVESLFAHQQGTAESSLQLSFVVEGCRVRIDQGGAVTVHPTEQAKRRSRPRGDSDRQ